MNPVSSILTAQEIPHTLFRHPGEVRSLAQAAEERGQQPEQVVRSLLFRLSATDFVMVLVSGERQIPWAQLRRYLKQRRITMASRDEVPQVTGYIPGTVSPVGKPDGLRLLIDECVLSQEELSIGSGEKNTTVILKTADLLRAVGEYERVNFFD